MLTSRIDDPSLAEAGAGRIKWYREKMDLVRAFHRRYERERPFAGKRLLVCMHCEPKAAVRTEALLAGGAERIVFVGNLGSTKPDTAAYLASLPNVTVLARRGDNLRGEHSFRVHPDGHGHACELVRQIARMNEGVFIDGEVEDCHRTNFCIGVAGYPEKHCEAPNPAEDMRRLKEKVDAGADYIITQMSFDNASILAFIENCRAAGIDVPIIPGIKPFSTKAQLTMLPQIFHVDLPEALVREVEKCPTNREVREVGVEWAVAQGRELIAAGVPLLHFYTMGKTDNMVKIAQALF